MPNFIIKKNEVKQNNKNIVSIVKTVIFKQYYNSNKQKFLMKIEPFTVLKSFLNFSASKPEYSHKLYSYKRKSV